MTKFGQIASALKNQIRAGALKPGDLLPSYRELMERYGVAVATVRQALGQLQAEGLIRSVHGRGCVVTEAASAAWDMVGIAVLEHGDNRMLLEDLDYLQQTFEKRHCDISLRLVHPLSRTEVDALPNQSITPTDLYGTSRLTATDLDGLVAWAKRLNGVLLYGTITNSVIDRIRGLKLNCVVVGYPMDRESPEDISMVTIDVESMVDMAVGYLAELGHRRILLVSGEGSWYFDKLASCFAGSMQAHGLEAGADRIVWYSGLKKKGSFATLLRKLPVQPTAVLVEEAVRAEAVVRDLIEAGFKVPHDISVMAISETAASAYIPRNLTSVVTSTRTTLLRATEIMQKLLRSGAHTVFTEKLAGRLVFGETCASPRDRLSKSVQ